MRQLLRTTIKFSPIPGQETRVVLTEDQGPSGDPLFLVGYLTSVDGAPEEVQFAQTYPTQEQALADMTTRITHLKALSSRN